jgi:hypothetical protein
MTWNELHFFSARLRLFLQRLEKEFPDTPMMWRSLTFHRKTGSKDIMLIEMDRYGRALAEQHGHEVFEWARIMKLLGGQYEAKTHPGEGASSWLWGNMVLEYLARAAGAGAQVGGDGMLVMTSLYDGEDDNHQGMVV